MIDEVAEVKRYMDGKGLDDSNNYYRACYMIAKYFKKLGTSKGDTLQKIAAWVRQYSLAPSFSLANCISAAYSNDRPLRCGTTVRISQEDADNIRLYASNKADRRVALALLCCAKGFAEEDGSFVASTCALASWLGMDRGNLSGRPLKNLESYGFIERLPNTELRGWEKNYYRNSCRFRLLVPYKPEGKWELKYNDIRTLYERVFGEAY